jgi:hypothetical protein
VLPRGCLEPLHDLLADLGIALELSDKRRDGQPLNARFTGELNSRQEDAVPAMLAKDLGVLCAPPGIGKTVIATRLIAERGRSTLVLVHRKPLLEQWVRRLGEFLELEADSIGTIGGGRGQPMGKVDVAMVQSLARHKTLDQLLAGYGHIVIDECHHVPAVMTERVLQAAPARYVTGLTATPKRRDGHHPIIAMQCGPVRHTIGHDATRSSQPLVFRVVRRDTPFDPQTLPRDPHIQEVFAALATDGARTKLIAKDTLELAAQAATRSCSPNDASTCNGWLNISPTAAIRSSPCMATCGRPSIAPHWRSSPAATATAAGWCSQPAATLARASTTPASTRCCWRCRSHGKAPSSSTPDACTAPTQASKTFLSTTTSTAS